MGLDYDAGGVMVKLDGGGCFVLFARLLEEEFGVVNGRDRGGTIFCPPGPEPLRKASSMSASLIFGRGVSGLANEVALV